MVEPCFTSPSTVALQGFNFNVFSIIKEGSKNQDYQLKIHNKSAIEANCRVSLPFDGHKFFLLFSVLPARVIIAPDAIQVYTIKIKVDFKKSATVSLEDCIDETGDLLQEPTVKHQDQQINTLLGLEIVDTNVRIVFPVRIMYKQATTKQLRRGR